MFLHSSRHCQPSILGVLTDDILTNDQICEWIASTVSEFRYAREHGVFTNRTSEQHDSETSTSPPTLVVTLLQASTSDKDDEHKQSSKLTVSQLGSVTVGQSPEEDGLRTTTKSSSEKKENSLILSEVSSIHKKKDEQCLVIKTTIDAFTSDELIKKSIQTVDANLSDKDSIFRLDGSRTLVDKNGESEVCQQQKGDEVKEGRVVAASRSSTTKEESRKDGKTQTDRASSSDSRQQNSTNVLEKRFQQTKSNHQAQSNTDGTPNFCIPTDPQYDDISDEEEPSCLTARFLRVERYEDVSEDENQGSGKQTGKMGSTPPVVSEPCSKTLENVQLCDSPKTPTLDEITDVHSPYSVETAESEHHLCIERDHGGQINHFLYEEFSDESDEESEFEFEVVPIMMSDFNPEPVEEEPASGKVMQHVGDHENQAYQHGVNARQSCAPKPVPASAFSKMAIYDTPDDQEQAIRCGQVSFVALPCGSPESTSGQGEDSCATEDSCSYSSGPECNYMTVSKELFKSISSAQRKTGHCVPENGEDVQISLDDGVIDNLALDVEDIKKQSQTSETFKQNDGSVVIILSDSDEEGGEKYNMAKMASTTTSVDCGRGSRQERNTATPEVATLDKNQKSSRSRESQLMQSDNAALTTVVISTEAEDSDDFSNAGVNVLERKKRRTASSHPKWLSKADDTENVCIIERMIVKESKYGEPATLVRVPRGPRQGPHEPMPMAKSSLTERDRIREQPDKPASIPTRTHVEAHKNSRRRIMHPSPSPSSDSPLAMDHHFTLARFPSSSAPVESMQVTSHARRKVFRTWKDQHVPLRKEKKHKRANAFRHPR